jgi:hypothetical protein
MKRFSREVWLERARTRLVRLTETDQIAAERQWAVDYAAIKGLERVIEWLAERNILVDFIRTDSGRFLPSINRIEISAKGSIESQLYILLHECGHYMIEQSATTRQQFFPNGYLRIQEEVKGRNLIHKVDVIAEEFEAWNRGLKLAHRLKIYLDREQFDKVKARSLQTYFRWAMRRGRVLDE